MDLALNTEVNFRDPIPTLCVQTNMFQILVIKYMTDNDTCEIYNRPIEIKFTQETFHLCLNRRSQNLILDIAF